MKVCMVGSDALPLPSTYGGGIERHIWELSRNLVKQDVEVYLLTLPSENHQVKERLDGVMILRGGILRFVDKFFPYAHPSFDLFALEKSLDKSFDFDIIHVHNGPPGMTLLPSKVLCRKKLIFTEHTPFLVPLRSKSQLRALKLKLVTASEALVPRFADKVIAISNAVVEGLVQKVGIPMEKIVQIPNGVDTNRFNPRTDGTNVKRRLNIEDKEIMLFVGRIGGGKGLHHIVNILPTISNSLPNVVFLIVGAFDYFSVNGKTVPDKYYRYLLEIATKLHVRNRLIFTGPIRDEELPSYYAACDLFVLPSYHEGFSLASAEALASGKPVVATRCGGIKDIVREGCNGFLVPIGDERALADRIVTLLADEQLARRMGENGRKMMEQKFSWKSIAIQVKRVYEDVLNES